MDQLSPIQGEKKDVNKENGGDMEFELELGEEDEEEE